MAVVKWDPFRDLLSIQDRMNKLFEQTLSRSRVEEGIAASTWAPAVDIYETPETIVMKAELPGLTREDIEIQIRDNTLTLKGERRFAKDVQEENYLRIERAYGAFQRSFTLPATVQQENIRAVFRDGVLELTLPKAEGPKPKKIAIEVR
ncbi:MAG: Hsp20/alpha crystallin family protein [candidate division NC10 bacterium]|nr:Hsp20/alpha crystallin family protein [candidate division NC10 bacterium]